MLVKTVQVNAFKCAIDSVKDILGEVTVLFSSKDGMILPAVDNAKKAFVYMRLQADKFEIYDVPADLTATFEIQNLYKIVKNAAAHRFNSISFVADGESLFVKLESTTIQAASPTT